MADVSLSTLPTATPTMIAPGTITVDGKADGATPFASLLTNLADPAAPASASVAALAAALAVPMAPIDPGLLAAKADAGAAPKKVDGETAADEGKDDPTTALAPDLSAFLALIAPPPQLAPTVVRAATPQVGTSSDGATLAPRTSAVAVTILTQLAPTASQPMREAPSLPLAPTVQDAPTPAPLEPSTGAELTPASDVASIATDRMAQAFAAVRAMAARTSEPAAAFPASAIVEVPTGAAAASPASAVAFNASPAGPARGAPAATAASTPSGPASSSGPTDTVPAAPPITASPVAAAPVVAPAVAVTRTAENPDATAGQDDGIAPRVPIGAVAPGGATEVRRADPALSVALVRPAAAAETQRPTQTRTRKVTDMARIGDVRADSAPARIEVASAGQAAPAPLPDDPVARQLSIAQDGQWLDSLAKDIAGAGNGNGQLNFRLDPDHLGSLTVQLTQTADGASVRLTASTEAARTILADAQPRLVAEARAQGLNLRDATIETRIATPAPAAAANASFSGSSSGGRGDQGGASAQLQQQSQQHGNSRQRAPDPSPRPAANPAPRTASTRSGADLYA